MPTKVVWLSYDLGVEGDYEGLYEWLAERRAKECGDSVAFFPFKYRTNLLSELAAALKAHVKVNRKTRFYAVFPNAQGKHRGKFVVGRRRLPPWSDFVPDDDEEEEDQT